MTNSSSLNSPEQRAARISPAQRRAAQTLAIALNGVIHTRNLYVISTGERVIDAHAEYGNVLVKGLHTGVWHLYQCGAFRDGNNTLVSLC